MSKDNEMKKEGIISVNSRGSQNQGAGSKALFVIILCSVVAALGVFGFVKYREHSKQKEKELVLKQRSEADETKAKSAAVAARRNFDSDPPPQAKISSISQPGYEYQCPDKSDMPVHGPDGNVLTMPNGSTVAKCSNGQLITSLPKTITQPSEVKDPPTLPNNTQGGQEKKKSRFAGGVSVNSNSTPSGVLDRGLNPNTVSDQNERLIQSVQDLISNSGKQNANKSELAGPSIKAKSEGETGSIGSMLEGSEAQPVSATMLGNRNMILPEGRSIDCALTIRIVSDLAGKASCVLQSNVYSDNGHVVLLERGSEATGEYRALTMQGQKRLFVLWTRIKSPNGVVINVASPAADALGTSGLDGYVDNHWGERIGAAYLLSIIQDGIQYEMQKAQSDQQSGGVQIYQNSARTSDQLAQKILDSTINIKPTLYKNQGDRGTIFVARDLDFGGVYALRTD